MVRFHQVVKEVLPFLELEEYPFQVLVVVEANLLEVLEHQVQEEVVDLLKLVVWEVHQLQEEEVEELMEGLIKAQLELRQVQSEYLEEEY
jgi:hypothetical protein